MDAEEIAKWDEMIDRLEVVHARLKTVDYCSRASAEGAVQPTAFLELLSAARDMLCKEDEETSFRRLVAASEPFDDVEV